MDSILHILQGRRGGKNQAMATMAVACWLCGVTFTVLDRIEKRKEKNQKKRNHNHNNEPQQANRS